MNKLKEITLELEEEMKKAKSNVFASKLISPLRLVLVWMNGVNQKLTELEQRSGGHLNG